MKVLIASSEVYPYSKSGGLADMVGALAKSLARTGVEVAVVTPLYRGIRNKFPKLRKLDWVINATLGPWHGQAGLWVEKPMRGLSVYFVDHQHFFDRPELYQENGHGYWDNPERFIFFSKAVVQLARYLPFAPDVVHVHDWQSALVPILVRHERERAGWGNAPRTCLTIHNLAYQGRFGGYIFDLTNLPPAWFNPGLLEFHGDINLLKGGILAADALTTVSSRYAREITTPAYGCGLDGVLRLRERALIGILNGVDYTEWKTMGNPCLPASYSARKLGGKAEAKRALQAELGLPQNPDIPLFGNITRLVDQKGSDIMLAALIEMQDAPIQFALLGSGTPELETAYRTLAASQPDKFAVRIGYDHALSHRIEAGCDFYLMPSRFEPCGLNQLYSLRYGTVPIVRSTGGLDDSVIDANEDPNHANGIKFGELTPSVLARAMEKALAIYAKPDVLQHYRLNGMSADFSWTKTALRYVQIYQELAGIGAKSVARPTAPSKAKPTRSAPAAVAAKSTGRREAASISAGSVISSQPTLGKPARFGVQASAGLGP